MGFILWINFNSNQKVVGYSYDICANIAPVAIACWDSWYLYLMGSQQGKIVNYFFQQLCRLEKSSQ